MSKIRLNLLVDEEYIESLVSVLPRDKVKIIEQDFDENIVKLEKALGEYAENKGKFKDYSQSMQELNLWLEDRGQK